MKKIFVLLIFVLAVVWLNKNLKTYNFQTKIKSPRIIPTGKPTPSATKTPTVSKQKPTMATDQEKNITTEEEFSYAKIPPSDHMSTPRELLEAINTYRKNRNLTVLTASSTLCEIAQKRAAEIQEIGDLDHSGFEKYSTSQNEFSLIGEILFTGPYPQSGAHIVELGWDKSQTGHREEMQNPVYTHGCAGISGYCAVFVFGAI